MFWCMQMKHPTYYTIENGVMFGLKWSLMGAMLAMTGLAGCGILDIEENKERHNFVQGERRTPQLNPPMANAPRATDEQGRLSSRGGAVATGTTSSGNQENIKRGGRSLPSSAPAPRFQNTAPSATSPYESYNTAPQEDESNTMDDIANMFGFGSDNEETVQPAPPPVVAAHQPQSAVAPLPAIASREDQAPRASLELATPPAAALQTSVAPLPTLPVVQQPVVTPEPVAAPAPITSPVVKAAPVAKAPVENAVPVIQASPAPRYEPPVQTSPSATPVETFVPSPTPSAYSYQPTYQEPESTNTAATNTAPTGTFHLSAPPATVNNYVAPSRYSARREATRRYNAY